MVYFLVKNINLLMLEVILKEDVFAEIVAEIHIGTTYNSYSNILQCSVAAIQILNINAN